MKVQDAAIHDLKTCKTAHLPKLPGQMQGTALSSTLLTLVLKKAVPYVEVLVLQAVTLDQPFSVGYTDPFIHRSIHMLEPASKHPVL